MDKDGAIMIIDAASPAVERAIMLHSEAITSMGVTPPFHNGVFMVIDDASWFVDVAFLSADGLSWFADAAFMSKDRAFTIMNVLSADHNALFMTHETIQWVAGNTIMNHGEVSLSLKKA
jgi:hypothetical protein